MKNDFEQKVFPQDIAVRPSFAIGRFTAAARKYGHHRVLTESKFKKAREVRTTAAFLLGLSKITGKTYWVKPEYEENTPDTYGISFSPHPKYQDGNVREILNIELKEYEVHSEEDLLSFIRGKLSNKYLPDHYILLVHANRAHEQINTEEVFTELSKVKLRLGEVWLLGNIEDGSDDKFVLVSLYRTRAGTFFHLEEEIARNSSQTEFITASRGKGNSPVVVY
jgi:hypothetical protein